MFCLIDCSGVTYASGFLSKRSLTVASGKFKKKKRNIRRGSVVKTTKRRRSSSTGGSAPVTPAGIVGTGVTSVAETEETETAAPSMPPAIHLGTNSVAPALTIMPSEVEAV